MTLMQKRGKCPKPLRENCEASRALLACSRAALPGAPWDLGLQPGRTCYTSESRVGTSTDARLKGCSSAVKIKQFLLYIRRIMS